MSARAVSARGEPRIIVHGDEQVHAPRCPGCGSDRNTRWVLLAPLLTWEVPTAHCLVCKVPFYPTRQEAHAAREPSRLEQRLAELRRSQEDSR